MSADTTLTCRDCGQAFRFTSAEREFYASRSFTEPGRCADCRATRKSQRDGGGSSYGSYGSSSSYRGGGGSYSSGGGRAPREMFTVTCSSCGQARPGAVPAQRRQAGLLLGLLRAAPGRWW
jgi:hypothetical protein